MLPPLPEDPSKPFRPSEPSRPLFPLGVPIPSEPPRPPRPPLPPDLRDLRQPSLSANLPGDPPGTASDGLLRTTPQRRGSLPDLSVTRTCTGGASPPSPPSWPFEPSMPFEPSPPAQGLFGSVKPMLP